MTPQILKFADKAKGQARCPAPQERGYNTSGYSEVGCQRQARCPAPQERGCNNSGYSEFSCQGQARCPPHKREDVIIEVILKLVAKGRQDAHPTRGDVIIEVILRFATSKGNLLV
ncbi:MAG: hypothetical protein ACKPJH_22450, partial [Dolichospermum sp.]